jgi:hypothetical protein
MIDLGGPTNVQNKSFEESLHRSTVKECAGSGLSRGQPLGGLVVTSEAANTST